MDDGAEKASIDLLASQIRDLKAFRDRERTAGDGAPASWFYASSFQFALMHLVAHFNAYSLPCTDELTESELNFFREQCRQFFERLSDYIDGESDQFIDTFGKRRQSFGKKGDAVSDRNRYWAIAAARAMLKFDPKRGRDCYEVAAKALGISRNALREWLWYRSQRGEKQPDAPYLRPRLLVIETGWIKGKRVGNHGWISGPGWTSDLAEQVLRDASSGAGFPTSFR